MFSTVLHDLSRAASSSIAARTGGTSTRTKSVEDALPKSNVKEPHHVYIFIRLSAVSLLVSSEPLVIACIKYLLRKVQAAAN